MSILEATSAADANGGSDPRTTDDIETAPGRNALFAAIQSTRMPMILTDPHQPDNPIIFANRAFEELSGYASDDLLGRNCRFLQGEETSPETVARIRDAIATRSKIAIDIVNYHKDGRRFVNELYISPVFAPAGHLLYFFGSQVDVTAYTETRLSMQLTLIERERHVLGRIAEGVPLRQVLEDLLRVVEAQNDNGMRTSILFVSEDGQNLCHGAAPSLPDAYNAAIDGIPIGEGIGSCGTVASRGMPVYATDVMTDPLWADFRELAREHDLRACWSTPIKSAQGSILGTFAIYYNVPRSPTAAEIAAIGFVTQTAALAIERHRNDVELRRSEERLHAVNEALHAANQQLQDVNENLERTIEDRTRALKLYGDIVQSSAAPICAFDHEYRLIAFNKAHSDDFFRIFGHRVQLGEVFPDLFLPDQAPIMRGFMARALTGEVFTVTEEFGDPDLAKPVWEVSYSPLRDDTGRVLGAFHYARDISERLRIERDLGAVSEQLAEQNASRERTWRFTPDLLSVVDAATGTFSRVSPAWTVALGWTAAEMEGHPFFDFVHPDDVEASAGALEQIQAGSPVLRFENRYRCKDGSWRWLSWVAFPEGDDIYSSARDVTEAHEREEALAQAEDSLRQSQKMEAVGQLTGGLAHDFNNLLAGISGSLELMQIRMQQGRMADVERYMTAAQGAAKRAAALTHRLLAFSRRQTLDPKPTNVIRLAMDMEELIQRTVGPGIAVEVVGATSSWPALIDPSQLENALLNLCINARDAMPDGGRITIETANKWMDARAANQHGMPEGQYLSLSVSDTGTGMAPELIDRVFEPFFTTKPIGEGTGLGLSMIYGFAKQSGGQVRIYSEVGQGTTVTIYLPRHHGDVREEKAEDETATPTRSHAGETVLVVDDEPTVRMLITDVLEELGYAALESGDSAAGLRILQSDARIDLLVTDVGLPGGMNGRQMADAARAVRPDLKVLFITGYAENALLGNQQLGQDMAVLTKPFAMDAMAARIRLMIESRR